MEIFLKPQFQNMESEKNNFPIENNKFIFIILKQYFLYSCFDVK